MSHGSASADDAFVEGHWRSGHLAVEFVPAEGALAGRPLVLIAARDSFEECVEEFRGMGPGDLRRLLREVVPGIRAALLAVRSVEAVSGDLTGDVLLLMAARVAEGRGILNGTGLSSMRLLVDPDPGLPWQDRGMLDPGFLRRNGLGGDGFRSGAAGSGLRPELPRRASAC